MGCLSYKTQDKNHVSIKASIKRILNNTSKISCFCVKCIVMGQGSGQSSLNSARLEPVLQLISFELISMTHVEKSAYAILDNLRSYTLKREQIYRMLCFYCVTFQSHHYHSWQKWTRRPLWMQFKIFLYNLYSTLCLYNCHQPLFYHLSRFLSLGWNICFPTKIQWYAIFFHVTVIILSVQHISCSRWNILDSDS